MYCLTINMYSSMETNETSNILNSMCKPAFSRGSVCVFQKSVQFLLVKYYLIMLHNMFLLENHAKLFMKKNLKKENQHFL